MTHSKSALLAGLALCVIALIIGQIAMSCRLTPGTAQNIGIVEDIGYTFTGLTAALGLILWKWGRTINVSNPKTIYHWRTRLIQATLAVTPVVFGCLYFHIAGKSVERHARTFAALPPLMYLLAIKGQKKNHSNSEQK